MGRPAKAAKGGDEQVNMDVDKRRELLHNLEMKHQRNASESDLLTKDEDVRRLRLRILMLRDENTSLREQIAQNNEANTTLAARCDNLGVQLQAKIEVVRSQEKQLRKQEREYSNLQAELQSMNNVTQDSANLLAEKLSLSRELAVLKPEIEHLRSQVNHQQETLAEKLALERQVNTLEVELANEKKATKRAMQKRESNDRVEDELRKKLRETEKKLTAEKTERDRLEDQLEQEKRTHQIALQDQDGTRELEADLRKKLQEVQRQLRQEKEDRERLEEELQVTKRAFKKAQKKQVNSDAEDELRTQLEEVRNDLESQQQQNASIRQESQTAVSELETRNNQLEKKIEKLKTKLHETQDQLKQCQADLRKAQQPRPSFPDDVTKTIGRSQAFRKRKAQDMTMDDFANIEIQTPSAEDVTKSRRLHKKRVLEPSLVGEKSAFSITPFLNRTKSVTEDTPKTDEGTLEDSITGSARAGPNESATTGSIALTAEATETKATSNAPAESEKSGEKPSEKPKVQPKARGRPKKVLGEAPSAKKNSQPVPKKILKSKSSLEKVTKEGEAGSQENKNESKEPAERTTTVKFNFTLPQDESSSSNPNGEQPKKKKRKVLGSTKTLFDEDEGEAPPARKPAKVQLGGAKRALAKAPLGGVKRNAFAGAASFSPLKKERRGVGASFLA
ncbi:hypothetical protein F4779DRAFT_588980 [Xylariaceae sp. FL0662B]|nr:hypothetical protein F4779DRAFT_588980 [Xylariaceae sp. FL0662B]